MDEGSETTVAAYERHIIERPRLTKILDESNARLILLVAPAGYGKTTLARQWLKDKPHVWYQATPASADPVEFAARLDSLVWKGKAGLAAQLRANPELAFHPEALADAICGQDPLHDERWLAIDDYQELADPATEQLIYELARRTATPAVIASRIRPRWVSARAVIYGEVLEVGTADLEFTREEVEDVLAAPSNVRNAFHQTRGWPALVGLAAALDRTQAPTHLPPTLVYDFFAEELLRGAERELETSLGRIALAPSKLEPFVQLAPEVAEAARQRGFLQEHEGAWSMHPLVRDFFARRLFASETGYATAREIIGELLDATAWDEAFTVIELIKDRTLMDELLVRSVPPLLDAGRLATAQRMCQYARRIGSVSPALDFVDADKLERQGIHVQALGLAHRAASAIDDGTTLKADALLLAAHAAYMADRPGEAGDLYAQASAVSQTIAQRREALWGTVVTELELGRGGAATALDGLLELAGTGDPTCVLRAGCAELQYGIYYGLSRGRLASARRAGAALPDVQDARLKSSYTSIYGLALCLSGDFAGAEAAGEEALREARAGKLTFAVPHIELRLAIARIGQGSYPAAARLINAATSPLRASTSYLQVFAQATRTRLLVAQGLAAESLETPLILPSDLPRLYCAEGIAIRCVAAACAGHYANALDLAEQAESITSDCQTLESVTAARALALADGDPERIDLASLFERIETHGLLFATTCAIRGSEPLRHAVLRATDTAALGRLARHLLSLAETAGTPEAAGGSRRKGLSPRENEVLDLLLQGLSNKQIARSLFISEVTVKVHLRHIYAKLGVKRRTEAVLIARDLEDARGTNDQATPDKTGVE